MSNGFPSCLLFDGDDETTLPTGWRWLRLGDVLAAQSGGTPSRSVREYYGGSIPWAKIEDLTAAGMWIDTTGETITDLGLANSAARVFPAGTVLLAMYASIGAASISRIPLATNQAILGCQCSAELHPEFFWFWLYLVRPDLLKRGRGGTQPNLNADIVKRLRMPLPPIDEQRRIAGRLQEQFERIEKARAAAAVQLKAAKALPAAYLRDVFESPEAQDWPSFRLDELLAHPVRTGISKPSSLSADKLCLTLSSVRAGHLDFAQAKPADVTDSAAEGCWVTPNAFYVVRGNGNKTLVGRGALAPASVPKVLFPDLLIQVIPDLNKILPEFLRLVWDSPRVRADIESRARTSAGIFKINQANLGAIRILCPPVDVQRSLSRVLDQKITCTRALQNALASASGTIEVLATASLRAAFQMGT